MIRRNLFPIAFNYKVTKTITNQGPLPNMIQYYLRNNQQEPLSFWNDIPISISGDNVNCVVEVPKQKHGKFEVKKNLINHPIMQDTRKNIFSGELQLRFYSQFPLFNYGYIPQTWQQNLVKDQIGYYGDDDPIDICDLTYKQKACGDVFVGKVLGSFCLIDQDEVDWKILVIDQEQSRQKGVAKIEDIDPRRIESIKKWFKIVKVFDGKKPNTIAFDQKIFNKEETLEVIKKTHQEWKQLLSADSQEIQSVRKKYHIQKKVLY